MPQAITALIYDRGELQTPSLTIEWNAKEDDEGCSYLERIAIQLSAFIGPFADYIGPLTISNVITLSCQWKQTERKHHGFYM
jgi:hypothetical protein